MEIFCSAVDFNSYYTIDLAAKIKIVFLSDPRDTVRELSQEDSMIVYLASYKFKGTSYNSIYRLMIRNVDNTLSHVQILNNSKTVPAAKKAEKLIAEIISSFKKGAGRMNLMQRTESNFILETKSFISIPKPAGYNLLWHRQPLKKQETYLVSKLVPFGNFPQPSFSIDILPNIPENVTYSDSVTTMADTQGEFMGIKGTWLNYYDKTIKMYFRK